MTTPPMALLPRQQEGDHPTTDNTRQPPANPVLHVLHHTPGRYLVVSKPFDVRMDGPFTHTVETLALSHLHTVDDPETPGFALRFVHRLDYATSGVLLIALGRAAAGVAATQFENRQVRKVYLALVHGHVHLPDGATTMEIDAPIANGLPDGAFHMMIGQPGREGRPSRTRMTVVAHGTYRGAPVSRVELEPLTGRRHQLRVHMVYAGWPIVGDATYAEKNDDAAFGAFVPPRMMLHARYLDIRLAVDELFGRKSGLRTARPFSFDAGDPFSEIENLLLSPVDPLPSVEVQSKTEEERE